jgi:hypothetical protein
MVSRRRGQAVIHIPLSQLRQLPGAQDLEDAWIRARAGEPGYLAGPHAETAACDAQTVPRSVSLAAAAITSSCPSSVVVKVSRFKLSDLRIDSFHPMSRAWSRTRVSKCAALTRPLNPPGLEHPC